MAPSMLKAALAVLPSLALAAPSSRYGSSNSDDLACAPSVDLSNGTYHGVSNEHYNQEFFLGIPYAQPPTGSLRFAPPQPIDESWDEPRDATKYGNICYGYGADTAALSNPISEDCLTLNIVRPAGTQPGDDLPVAIWVHGGSYTNGASADPRYNLTYIVDQSVKENKPFVAVSINYRLSYWGFLFSEEMEAAGAGNIAFKDQRLAFKWIQDNVAAFGGSADKVTIWGESAGARSLGMQLVAYDGQHDGLFHGAILESGSPVTKFVDAAAWQPYFDAVVEKTGCSDSADHLECLRELPAKTLNDVFNNTTPVKVTPPSLSAVLDGDFMTAQAQELLAAGKFAHVPLLLGNNFDEGTAYGKKGLNTSEQFVSYLSTLNLTDAQVSQIATLYPDDPDVGIPASYVGRPTDPSYGPQWKRAAAFAGDWQQHAGRRALAESYAQADLSVYSYLWNVYVNGISNILGATHFQEVAFVFYDLTSSEFKNKPETFKELSNLMSRQWVNFINDANPNLSVSPNENTPAWPLYSPAQPDNLVFDVNVTGLAYTAEDNYRAEAITYLQENVYE